MRPALSTLECLTLTLARGQRFGATEGRLEGRNLFVWIIAVIVIFVLLGTLESFLLPEGQF